MINTFNILIDIRQLGL